MIAAWAVTAVVLAALAVVVARQLGNSHGPHSGHGSMDMHQHAADAFTRAGGSTGTRLLGARLLTAWQLDAIAVALVVVLAALYVTGLVVRARRDAPDRATPWPWWHTASFLAGLVVIVYATCGAIAVYDQVLFTAHMAGHLALVMLAPALLVAGHPLLLWSEAVGPTARDRLLRRLRGPVPALLTAPPVALASYTVVIVGSHLSGLMDVIMRNTWAGQVEHLVYLLAGYQFFVLVVGHEPIRWRLSAPARWLLLAVAMAVDTFTGIVLMQGRGAVDMQPAGFAVNTLSDTRTGGAIMWFGGDAIMAVVMVVLVFGWLRRADQGVAEESGWLEQARRQTFETHTGTDLRDGDIDEGETARSSYNEWLAGLNRER